MRSLLVFLVSLFLIPFLSHAYAVPTHESLTAATLSSLNHPAITGDDTRAILKGVSDEDIDHRPVNHFYDPIYSRGLTVGGINGAPSPQWATDTVGQVQYWDSIYRRCDAFLSLTKKFYQGSRDYSWERGVYEYVYGDRAYSMEVLGHMLHLLQDATTPVYTRNQSSLLLKA